MTTENQKPAEKNAVAYTAYKVEERPRQKPYWHRLGTAWAHDDGEGFNYTIPPGVTVSGDIVFRRRKTEEAQQPAAATEEVPA